jgi:hypothetical protein
MTVNDDGVAQLRKDHTSLAASISAVTMEVGALKTEQAVGKAVATEQQKNLDDRLERIEESIKGLYGLGKWMLLAFGTSLIAAVVTFVVRGGLNVPPGT